MIRYILLAVMAAVRMTKFVEPPVILFGLPCKTNKKHHHFYSPLYQYSNIICTFE